MGNVESEPFFGVEEKTEKQVQTKQTKVKKEEVIKPPIVKVTSPNDSTIVNEKYQDISTPPQSNRQMPSPIMSKKVSHSMDASSSNNNNKISGSLPSSTSSSKFYFKKNIYILLITIYIYRYKTT